MIENGGLISLLFLSRRAEIDEEWKKEIEEFLDQLEASDYEY